MMKGRSSSSLVSKFLFVFGVLLNEAEGSLPVPVPVGVVLDFDTVVGKMSRTSMALAMEDFYSSNENYSTRLDLHMIDSENDVVKAAFLTQNLVNTAGALAIIGPSTSSQAEFMVKLGNRSQVPIVSFTATSPSISPSQLPYLLRTTLNDSSQVQCIAAILKLFEWREIVIIYEDTQYGSGIVPFLVDAMEEENGRIPYRSVIDSSADDVRIREELYKLRSLSTRVFVIHTSSSLGARILVWANKLEMIDDGFAWIVTDGVANMLENMDDDVLEAMDGVIGVRPLLLKKEERYNKFTMKWQKRFERENPGQKSLYPTIYSLRAYDTVWAMAMAVENISKLELGSWMNQTRSNSSKFGDMAVSPAGKSLLKLINEAVFKGLAGKFQLVNGEIKSSVFQIVNVHRGHVIEVGQWSEKGILRERNLRQKQKKVENKDDLLIYWPGGNRVAPKAWVQQMTGKKMKIGVPVKNGFKELVKVENITMSNYTVITGFSIDIFDAVMKTMPYSVPYEYVALITKDYDTLIEQVALKRVDAVVGDVTILSKRAEMVDFTLPYTESGWTMLVLEEDKGPIKGVFLKPWKTDLWIASFVFLLFTGFVVWFIEHPVNPHFRGSPQQYIGQSLYFTFSTMVYAHRDKLKSNLSRLVVVVWIFVAFILQSSFTANFTSILTVPKLEPVVANVKQLLDRKENVGCYSGSFICKALENQLNFSAKNIMKYDSPEQYAQALTKGTKNGGVAAIFDEKPYLKIFLSKYCSGYTTAGPTYKANGFGFVFPEGSPLVRDVSSAILSLSEGDEMDKIQNEWFKEKASCTSNAKPFSSSSLSLRNFVWLFYATGVVSSTCVAIFLGGFFLQNYGRAKGAAAWARLFDQKKSKGSFSKRDSGKKSSDNVVCGDKDDCPTMQGPPHIPPFEVSHPV